MAIATANCALLVQLVERRSPKPDVGGSSPPGRAAQDLTLLGVTYIFTHNPKAVRNAI